MGVRSDRGQQIAGEKRSESDVVAETDTMATSKDWRGRSWRWARRRSSSAVRRLVRDSIYVSRGMGGKSIRRPTFRLSKAVSSSRRRRPSWLRLRTEINSCSLCRKSPGDVRYCGSGAFPAVRWRRSVPSVGRLRHRRKSPRSRSRSCAGSRKGRRCRCGQRKPTRPARARTSHCRVGPIPSPARFEHCGRRSGKRRHAPTLTAKVGERLVDEAVNSFVGILLKGRVFHIRKEGALVHHLP